MFHLLNRSYLFLSFMGNTKDEEVAGHGVRLSVSAKVCSGSALRGSDGSAQVWHLPASRTRVWMRLTRPRRALAMHATAPRPLWTPCHPPCGAPPRAPISASPRPPQANLSCGTYSTRPCRPRRPSHPAFLLREPPWAGVSTHTPSRAHRASHFPNSWTFTLSQESQPVSVLSALLGYLFTTQTTFKAPGRLGRGST